MWITHKPENGHLLLKLPSGPRRFASTVSETLFILPHTDGRFTFQKDDQGRVTGVRFEVGDGERELIRARK